MKICKQCKKEMSSRKSKFCNYLCSLAFRREFRQSHRIVITVLCKQCKKPFIKKTNKSFCSVDCRSKFYEIGIYANGTGKRIKMPPRTDLDKRIDAVMNDPWFRSRIAKKGYYPTTLIDED